MEHVPEIGPRILRSRKMRKLTLDALSKQSGISKSILSDLENGKGNPTFATLWSIARALDMNLGELTDNASEVSTTRIEVLQRHFVPEIRSRDGLCLLKILSPVDTIGKLEWYEVSVERNGELASSPHTEGTVEHLTLLQGTLKVESGKHTSVIGAGDTARYPADSDHRITNTGDQTAIALLVVMN